MRSRLVLGTLWIENGRVRDASELVRELLARYPAVKLRPFVQFQGATALDGLGEYAGALDLLDELERTMPDEPWSAALRCQVPALRAQVDFGLGVIDLAVASARRGRACLDGLESPGRNHAILMEVQELNVELAGARWDAAVERVRRALADEWLYPPRSAWRGSLLGGESQALLELERRGRADASEVERVLAQAAECELVERDGCKLELLRAERALERGAPAQAAESVARARARLTAWREHAGVLGPIPEELLVAASEARVALAREADTNTDELRARLVALEEALARRVELWNELAPVRRGGTGFLQDSGLRAALIETARLAVRVDGERAGAERALATWMTVQAQGSIARALGIGAASVAEVRAELLAPGRGIVVLLPGPARSLALALERDDAFAVELASESELEERRGELLAARASGEANAARGAGERLAAALFPARLGASLERWSAGVTFVGLDLAGDPPVGALPLPSGARLGVARAFDVLPSLPLGLALARRARELPLAQARLVLVAAPRTSPALAERFPDLAELAWDDDASASPPPPARLTVFARDQATLANVVAAARGASELEFVTHCVQDARRERPASLVLADADGGEGLLSCDAIEERALAASLVVLSACRAALGPRRRGDEGTGHLGGAFLRAGAQAVLLSGDDLELAPARRLSARFHARLYAGDSPAEALRAARAAEESERAPLAAELTVFGLGHAPLFERAAPPTHAAGEVLAAERDGIAREIEPAPASSRAVVLVGAGACALLALVFAWRARRARRSSL